MNDIVKGIYQWPKRLQISQDAKDFVSSLLLLKGDNRMTALEAINHKWLTHLNHRHKTTATTTVGKGEINTEEEETVSRKYSINGNKTDHKVVQQTVSQSPPSSIGPTSSPRLSSGTIYIKIWIDRYDFTAP